MCVREREREHPYRDPNGFAVRSLIASSVILSERFDPFAAIAWETQDVEYRVPRRRCIAGIYRSSEESLHEEITTGNDARSVKG